MTTIYAKYTSKRLRYCIRSPDQCNGSVHIGECAIFRRGGRADTRMTRPDPGQESLAQHFKDCHTNKETKSQCFALLFLSPISPFFTYSSKRRSLVLEIFTEGRLIVFRRFTQDPGDVFFRTSLWLLRNVIVCVALADRSLSMCSDP